MNQKLIAVSIALLVTTSAFADRSKCDRGRGWDKLTEAEQKELLSEDTTKSDKFVNVITKAFKTDSEFNMAYIYKVVAKDPESVMAVFSNYEDSPKYLGPEIQSAKILDPLDENGVPVPSKRTKIKYEFNPGALVSNSTYTVLDTLKKPTKVHALNWEWVDSSGSMGRPIYIDGFFKAEPAGSNANYTLITYCNYVVPEISSMIPGRDTLIGKINKDGLELTKQTIVKTSNWTLKQSASEMNSHVARYRSIKF